MVDKPHYRINYDDIPVINITPEDPGNVASFVFRMVYGTDTSIMFADRAPGYHTKPHYHDAEQVNFVLSGEIWFFVEQDDYRCRKGDIMRIPHNKIHWAWNRSPGHCTLIESHTPPLTAVEGLKDKAVPLLGPDEDRTAIRSVTNIRDPYDQAEIDSIEARAVGEEG